MQKLKKSFDIAEKADKITARPVEGCVIRPSYVTKILKGRTSGSLKVKNTGSLMLNAGLDIMSDYDYMNVDFGDKPC